MLGLSTQVTAVWSYISGGPYKTYEWDKTKIEFKHRTNKEATGLSPMTILVIQALKTLGKIDDSFIYLCSVGVLRDNMVPYAPALFLNG